MLQNISLITINKARLKNYPWDPKDTWDFIKNEYFNFSIDNYLRMKKYPVGGVRVEIYCHFLIFYGFQPDTTVEQLNSYPITRSSKCKNNAFSPHKNHQTQNRQRNSNLVNTIQKLKSLKKTYARPLIKKVW